MGCFGIEHIVNDAYVIMMCIVWRVLIDRLMLQQCPCLCVLLVINLYSKVLDRKGALDNPILFVFNDVNSFDMFHKRPMLK